MEKVFIPLLVTLFLVGCSQQTSIETTNPVEEVQGKQVQDCTHHIDRLQNTISSNLETVFYSPKESTCMYIYTIEQNNGIVYALQSVSNVGDNVDWIEFCDGLHPKVIPYPKDLPLTQTEQLYGMYCNDFINKIKKKYSE